MAVFHNMVYRIHEFRDQRDQACIQHCSGAGLQYIDFIGDIISNCDRNAQGVFQDLSGSQFKSSTIRSWVFLYNANAVTVRKIFRCFLFQIPPVRIKSIWKQILYFGIQNDELGQITKTIRSIDIF